MPLEKNIADAIDRYLKRVGAWILNVHGSGVGRAGIPDRLCCYRGWFIAIEIKKPGGKPTKLQAHELERIRRAGGFAIVATSINDVRSIINLIDRDLIRKAAA